LQRGDQNLLSQAPPIGRYVKLFVPAAFAVVSLVSRRVDVRPVVKIVAESLSQHDEKHAVPPHLVR
jgi:hypothetical protein